MNTVKVYLSLSILVGALGFALWGGSKYLTAYYHGKNTTNSLSMAMLIIGDCNKNLKVVVPNRLSVVCVVPNKAGLRHAKFKS